MKRKSMFVFGMILPVLKKAIRWNAANNSKFKHAIWTLLFMSKFYDLRPAVNVSKRMEIYLEH